MSNDRERRQPVVPLLSAAEEQRIRELDGLHVGLLTDEEYALFQRAILSGVARRSYEEPTSGLLGMAKVRALADQKETK